jgi:hypothetical protein
MDTHCLLAACHVTYPESTHMLLELNPYSSVRGSDCRNFASQWVYGTDEQQ